MEQAKEVEAKMSDDLVKRLRQFASKTRHADREEAADRIEELEKALRVAAGYISTKEGHTEQHPQDVYDWIFQTVLEKNDEKSWDVHARVHKLERQANFLVHALQSIVSVQNPKEWREFCEELIAETFAVLKGEK